MYFRNYGLPKTQLDKYQKSTSLEYTWTTKMGNAPKHCSYLKDGSFRIFIDYCAGN